MSGTNTTPSASNPPISSTKRMSRMSMGSTASNGTPPRHSSISTPPDLALYLPSREPITLAPSNASISSSNNPEVVITMHQHQHPHPAPIVTVEDNVAAASKRSSLSIRSIPLSPASKALVDQSLIDNSPLSGLGHRLSNPSTPVVSSSPSMFNLGSGRRPSALKKLDSATMIVASMDDIKKVKTRKRVVFMKGSNQAKANFLYLFRYRGSILPHIILPTFLITLWAIFWVLIHLQAKWTVLATSPLLISVIGVVLSLLLVFRNNTAYDRYWEGRRIWGTIITHCRNLSRIMGNSEGNAKVEQEKRGALNLVLAFPIATKYLLRGETGVKYTDLIHLLAHVPAFNPSKPQFNEKNVPLEILFHLTSYIYRGRKAETYDVQGQAAFFTALTGLVDCATNLERIRNSPIPLVYNIHLKVVVLIYLLSLPFQLVGALNYFCIPVIAIASFVFLGIEGIALEIENPFGEDANDLPLEDFIDQVRREIQQVIASDSKRDPSLWFSPSSEETASRKSMGGAASPLRATPPRVGV
ncbi:hypothetical protein HDU67_006184 [Dinochytrium kinnereticum]|nr:hypothetical protein HDU67_006184 [Dinochytrium kinnereticum]